MIDHWTSVTCTSCHRAIGYDNDDYKEIQSIQCPYCRQWFNMVDAKIEVIPMKNTLSKSVDAIYSVIKARQVALDNLYYSVDAYRRLHSELESGIKQDDGSLSHLYATMLIYLEEAEPLVMPYINEKEE